MNRLTLFLLFVALSFSPEPLGAQNGEISHLIQSFNADRGALERKYSIRESAEFYDRMAAHFHTYITQLERVDFEFLTHSEQVDFVAFKNYIQKEAYFLELENKEYQAVSHVTDFAGPVYDFIRQRRRGTQPHAETTATMFLEAKKALEVKQAEVAESEPFHSWQQAEKAADVVNALHSNLQEALKFYLHYDVEFTWWCKQPGYALVKSMEDYAAFLRDYYSNKHVEDDGSGIIGKPIGRAALLRSLQFEMIPYSPEELIAAAEKEMKWCENEMRKASSELGLGDDWRAALEKVKENHAPPGEWPQEINAAAEEAIQFLEENDLITIPELAKETWRMKMLTAKQQETAPFFLGGESVLIAYPVDSMSHEEKLMRMRGNNRHFARAVVHHELIPGHHLQQFMNKRHQTLRRLFYTPFWIEGWALYWEMNLWDLGFAQSPEDRIGMLFWRMHRSARIIFSLNYHLEKMTPQECIDYLVERVGHERANAEAEVRRSFTGRYGPLYQIAYLVGGWQFMELRRELVDSGKMDNKAFHDRIMRENTLPVELIRAILTEQPLDKDFKSHWKFLK